MVMGKNIQNWADEAKLLWKLSLVVAICSAALALVIFFSGIYNKFIAFDAFPLLIIPYLVVAVLAIHSFFLGYFEEKTALEEEERGILQKRREKMALDVDEDAVFQWQRSLGLFKKYSPYIVTLINIVLIASLLYLFWSYWGRRLKMPELENPLECAFATTLISLVCLFSGIFCIGQSRVKLFRTLRPIGAWLVASSIIGIIAVAVMILYKFNHTGWDIYFRKISFIFMLVLACELLVNLIIEFYRPRSAFEDRPVFESRVLSLVTEPGGVVRNITDTLDYQFGFRITRQEIFSFAEHAVIPLLIVWLFALWIFTCIVEVKSNEIGVRELFGERQDGPVLEAGIYFKAPWPFANIARFPVYEIQELLIGPEMKDEKGQDMSSELILWTKKHYAKEPRFLVAAARENAGDDAPVSFLAAAFPVQFKIRKNEIVNYAYIHDNTPAILKSVAEQEVTKYLASVDILKAMSVDRMKTLEDLTKMIQDRADANDLKLGVDVISVNFLDAHPPTDEVAPSFEAVVGALEEKETNILSARKYENKVVPEAESEAYEINLFAQTDSDNTVRLAEAEKDRFSKQLQAYRLMPDMFRLRNYLDFFENDCRDVRKIVIGSTIPHNVFILNLEEKERLDLIDADLSDLGSK